MRVSGWLGAAVLMLATPHITANEAHAMQVKPSSSNPIVAIGVTEYEEAIPDIATITAGVDSNNKDAKMAMDLANKKMAGLMAAIQAAKIDPKDVQTSGVNVREDFDYSSGEPTSKGYKASNSVTLTVRDLSKLKTLMSDLVAAGATELTGPNFDLDNADALTDRARMKAFDSAKQRAMAYATKAGFKSVRLLMVNENAGYGEVYPYAAAAADAAAAGAEAAAEAMKAVADTPIEPGLIQRMVTATFQFEMVP